jgi:hypothetical protein
MKTRSMTQSSNHRKQVGVVHWVSTEVTDRQIIEQLLSYAEVSYPGLRITELSILRKPRLAYDDQEYIPASTAAKAWLE